MLIQPLKKVEGMQQTRVILRTEALLALRQMVIKAHRLTANKLHPRHRPLIPSALRMIRVFNSTPMYVSKETE